MLRLGVALFVLSQLSPMLAADDWPQFLGTQRTGISSETNLINGFGQGGPNVLWRTAIGEGMSGIAVAGDLVCTLYQDASQQYAVAVNRLTGQPVWRSAIAPSYRNAMGDGPRSTPAIDRGQMFAMTGEGIVVCLTLKNGHVEWRYDTIQKLGGRPAEYGMACSPVVTNEHVIVTVGAPRATVLALDRLTGEVVWTAGTDAPAGYSSPALLSISRSIQLVVFYGSGVFGLQPETGKVIWNYPFPTDYDCNIATPIAIDGRVLISSGENHGAVLLDVPTSEQGQVREVWTSLGNRSVLRNEWQTSIHLDGYLYAFDNIGSAGPVTNLCCVNAKTGEQVWQKKRFGKGNLIAADGKLWCSTMEGELVIVRATPDSFQELGRATVLGSTRQAPALSNGQLFLRDATEIVCVDIKK